MCLMQLYRVVGVIAEYRAFKIQGTCEICENGIGDETHFLNYCHYLVNIVLREVLRSVFGGRKLVPSCTGKLGFQEDGILRFIRVCRLREKRMGESA